MKVKRWRQKAVNRERWAYVIKEVKALTGPRSQAVSNITLWRLKNIFYRMLPDFRRCIPFFKVPRFRLFALVLRAACRDKDQMEHCWNDNDKEKPRYWEKIMSHNYLVNHESHMQRRGIERRPPRVQVGDWPSEPWHRSLTLILLTCRIWWVLNNASRWQMGFNSAFKGLRLSSTCNEFINNYFAHFWNHMQLSDKNSKFIL